MADYLSINDLLSASFYNIIDKGGTCIVHNSDIFGRVFIYTHPLSGLSKDTILECRVRTYEPAFLAGRFLRLFVFRHVRGEKRTEPFRAYVTVRTAEMISERTLGCLDIGVFEQRIEILVSYLVEWPGADHRFVRSHLVIGWYPRKSEQSVMPSQYGKGQISDEPYGEEPDEGYWLLHFFHTLLNIASDAKAGGYMVQICVLMFLILDRPTITSVA